MSDCGISANCRHMQGFGSHAAAAMGDVPDAIKRRHIAVCSQADPAFGAGASKALGRAT